MTRLIPWHALVATFLSLAVSLPALAEDNTDEQSPTEQPKTADTGKEEEPGQGKPKAEPKPKDPFEVPDGTPEELIEYLEDLRQLRPKGIRTRQEFMEFSMRLRKAMIEATDKILAAEPTDEQFEIAAQLKLAALEMLSMQGAPDTEKQITSFIDQLKKAGKTKLARSAQAILFMRRARTVRDALTARKLLDEVNAFLQDGPVTTKDARLMSSIARALEYGPDPELAAEACRRFAKLAATSEDEDVARLAERFQAVARRLSLLGSPIKIEGVTMDGEEFQWEEFRKGKVVLIDFWATWCGWCIKEIPEMKELYKAYNDRGFAIVGISGDRSREPLEEFLEKTEIPWTILYGKDGPSPTIEYYGISAWPTMLLVGKDGNVVSLRARGETLREELKRLLGPMEEEGDEKPDADKEDEKSK